MIDNIELKEFIKSVCSGVRESLSNDVDIYGKIKFDLAIAVTKEGGLKISQVGGKMTKETTSRVQFELVMQQKGFGKK